MTQVALVGGAHIHAPGFAKKLAEAGNVKTRYVWDPDPAVAKARQEVTGGEIVRDPATIFADGDVAAVVICSQTDLHERLVTDAAAAGKHMFVEKPLGMGGTDAYRMAQAIERAGVIFQTGYFMRGQAGVQAVRKLLADGLLGQITRMRLSNCHSGSLGGWFDTDWRWMADPARAGCGGFGDLGTHVLDLLLWLREGDAVQACTGIIQSVTQRYGDCDESGEALIRFASGTAATIAAGWVDRANPNFLEVSGTQGHAHITRGKLYVNCEALGADGKEPYANLPDAWPHAFDIFLAHLTGDTTHPCVGVREAALRNSVMEAIYDGAASQQWARPSIPTSV